MSADKALVQIAAVDAQRYLARRSFGPKGYVAIGNVTEESGMSEFRQVHVWHSQLFLRARPDQPHYVKHDFVRGHEVVCDDAAMALPPNCFGAHYCTWVLISEIA